VRERKVFSVRGETISEISIIRASTATTAKERMGLVVDRMKSGKAGFATVTDEKIFSKLTKNA
jgi:hypothetical protein